MALARLGDVIAVLGSTKLKTVVYRIGQLKIYCWSVRITVQDTEDVIHTGTVASVNLHSLVLIAL